MTARLGHLMAVPQVCSKQSSEGRTLSQGLLDLTRLRVPRLGDAFAAIIRALPGELLTVIAGPNRIVIELLCEGRISWLGPHE
jgi:hypothetical protein